jgi:hypothetical protein
MAARGTLLTRRRRRRTRVGQRHSRLPTRCARTSVDAPLSNPIAATLRLGRERASRTRPKGPRTWRTIDLERRSPRPIWSDGTSRSRQSSFHRRCRGRPCAAGMVLRESTSSRASSLRSAATGRSGARAPTSTSCTDTHSLRRRLTARFSLTNLPRIPITATERASTLSAFEGFLTRIDGATNPFDRGSIKRDRGPLVGFVADDAGRMWVLRQLQNRRDYLSANSRTR